MGEGLAMTMFGEAFTPPRVTMVILPIGVVCSWPASQPFQFGSAVSITHCKMGILGNTADDHIGCYIGSLLATLQELRLCVMR